MLSMSLGDTSDDSWVDDILDGEGTHHRGSGGKRLDGTLPPEVPLTEKDLTDPLLQPLPESSPPEAWDVDGWEIVTDTGESFEHHSVQGLVKWLMRDGRLQSVERISILRHRKGQLK